MNRIKLRYLLSHPLVLGSYILEKPRSRIVLSKFKSNINELYIDNLLLWDGGLLWYDCCEYIYAFIRKYKPKNVVETGIRSGFSSYFILKALHDNNYGKLYSIEPNKIIPENKELIEDTRFVGKEVGWVVPNELRYRWEIITGLSDDKLVPLLDRLGSIDLFLHDSLHTDKVMSLEYNTAWKYLNRGGLLMSDDIRSLRAFYNFVIDKQYKIYFHRLGIVFKV
jgi:hypothetical protein